MCRSSEWHLFGVERLRWLASVSSHKMTSEVNLPVGLPWHAEMSLLYLPVFWVHKAATPHPQTFSGLNYKTCTSPSSLSAVETLLLSLKYA
jgi:hypothetical protein